MKEQLRRLTGDSAIYGISTMLGRLLNFLLVPFYTNVFVAADYGIVTVVYTVIAFLNVVYALGLEQAYMRFSEDRDAYDARDVFSTPLLAITGAGFVLSGVIAAFAAPLAGALDIPARWDVIVTLAAGTLVVDAFNVVPFAALRMQRRATRFATIRFTSIVLNVGLNLWFVLGLGMSIVSVFWAGLIASLASTAMLAPDIVRTLRPRLRTGLLREMMHLGLPTLPAGLALMVVQVLDRLLMQILVDTRTAGIYGANYRLGIFMMLFVTMFQFAWQPFSLQQSSQAGAERLFARVLTYFTLAAVLVWLVLSFVIDDLATVPLWHGRSLIGREYWSGLAIVPVVLGAYIFTGMSVIFNAGLLIRKRTGAMALVTAVGAAVNVVANLVLIPRLGMMGGALSTLAAYAVMALLYWHRTRRVYPVPYEWGRLARIALAGVVPFVVWLVVPQPSGLPELAWEAVLAAGYPALLGVTGFFLKGERAEMGRLLRR
jgi:O-antigen/teichoic acid export membrane protein